MRREFVKFTDQHVEDAAQLLAARHRADRLQQPDLPLRYEDAAATSGPVHALLMESATSGVAAIVGGRLAGYLLGRRMLPAPASVNSFFFPPRSVLIPYAGHAVADADGVQTYRELYRAAAPGWLDDGYFSHSIELPASNRQASHAWFSLGFGQEEVLAVRDTAPLPNGETPAGVEVREAGVSDGEMATLLEMDLFRYHAASPMFAPLLPELGESGGEIERGVRDVLAHPLAGHAWLAIRDGRGVGLVLCGLPPSFLRMVIPAGSIHLQTGFVVSEERGTGVGAALLQRALTWARENGYGSCALNYLSANIPGERFWSHSGFRPARYRLTRRVDERIAWALG